MPSALSGMAFFFVRCVLLFSTAAPPASAAAQSLSGRLIHQDDLPLRITKPGLWLVAEDLVTEGQQLEIDAPDVTLDLRGFTIDGGLWIISGDGLTVRNGTMIGDYPYYIINGNPPDRATIEHIHVSGGGEEVAIELGNNAAVHGLTAAEAAFETLLIVGDDGLLTDVDIGRGPYGWDELEVIGGDRCVVRNHRVDGAAFGLRVGSHSLVEKCDIWAYVYALQVGANSRVFDSRLWADPGSSPSDGTKFGLHMGDGSVVTRCHLIGFHGIVGGADSTVLDCEVPEANHEGIIVGTGSLVQGCRLDYLYKEEGIRVSSDSRVIDNVFLDYAPNGIVATGDGNYIQGNRILSDWHGIRLDGSNNVVVGNTVSGYPEANIYVGGQGNRVEGNQLSDGWLGIQAPGSGNLIVGNTFHDVWHQAFELAPGNAVGEIIDTTNGGVVPPGNCWANVIE